MNKTILDTINSVTTKFIVNCTVASAKTKWRKNYGQNKKTSNECIYNLNSNNKCRKSSC